LKNVRDEDLRLVNGDKNIEKTLKVNGLIDCWLLKVQRQIFDEYEGQDQGHKYYMPTSVCIAHSLIN
jgi:hypothetical protein